MDRRRKEIAGLAIAAISLVTMMALMFSMMNGGSGYSWFVGVVMILLAVVGLFGLLVGITFSHAGWEVEGSTLEWVLAAAISPFTTLIFYLFGKVAKENEEDRINPADHRRIGRL